MPGIGIVIVPTPLLNSLCQHPPSTTTTVGLYLCLTPAPSPTDYAPGGLTWSRRKRERASSRNGSHLVPVSRPISSVKGSACAAYPLASKHVFPRRTRSELIHTVTAASFRAGCCLSLSVCLCLPARPLAIGAVTAAVRDTPLVILAFLLRLLSLLHPVADDSCASERYHLYISPPQKRNLPQTLARLGFGNRPRRPTSSASGRLSWQATKAQGRKGSTTRQSQRHFSPSPCSPWNRSQSHERHVTARRSIFASHRHPPPISRPLRRSLSGCL